MGYMLSPSTSKRYGADLVVQKAIYAVTNANEGGIFPNPQATNNVTAYIENVFPTLSKESLAKGAALYTPLGSAFTAATLVIGEGNLLPLNVISTERD